jgi:hypothetical protein
MGGRKRTRKRKRTRSQSEALQVGIQVSGLKDENDKPMEGLFLEAGQAKKGDFLAFFVGSEVEKSVYDEWVLANLGEPKYGIHISEDVVLDCGGEKGRRGLARYANSNTNNNATIRIDRKNKKAKARLYAKKVIKVGEEIFTPYGRWFFFK